MTITDGAASAGSQRDRAAPVYITKDAIDRDIQRYMKGGKVDVDVLRERMDKHGESARDKKFDKWKRILGIEYLDVFVELDGRLGGAHFDEPGRDFMGKVEAKISEVRGLEGASEDVAAWEARFRKLGHAFLDVRAEFGAFERIGLKMDKQRYVRLRRLLFGEAEGDARVSHAVRRPRARKLDQATTVFQLPEHLYTELDRKKVRPRMNKGLNFGRVNFKSQKLLTEFVGETGRILPRSRTLLSSKAQRKLKRVIKLARQMALLPIDKRLEFGRVGADFRHALPSASHLNAEPSRDWREEALLRDIRDLGPIDGE